MGITEILRGIWLFSAISESFSKQLTQLIIAAHNCHTKLKSSKVLLSNVYTVIRWEDDKCFNGTRKWLDDMLSEANANLEEFYYSVWDRNSCRFTLNENAFSGKSILKTNPY